MQNQNKSIAAQLAQKCDEVIVTIDTIIATLKHTPNDRRTRTSIKIRVD